MNKKRRPLLVTLFLLGCNGLFAQTDSTEKFVFLEYGFSDSDECSSIKYIVGENWNIDFKRVANCMVTGELVDSVRIFNLNTSERLTKKYGADWEERYQGEIASAVEKCRAEVNLSKVDTVTRESTEFTERIINNPDFDVLEIEITQNKKKEKESPQSLTIHNLNDESNKILYLGFQNTFEINLANYSSSVFRMECVNCEIKTTTSYDSLAAGHFMIRAKKRRETILTIYANDELLTSHIFDVRLLPDPEIFFNEVENGNSIDRSLLDSTAELIVRYSDSITLRSEFIVEKWEIHPNEVFQLWGSGSRMSKEYIRSLKSLPIGTMISFICRVRCPDGSLRKKVGSFVLN